MIQKPTTDLHAHSTPHSTPDPHSAHAAAQAAVKPSSSGGSPPLGNPSVEAHRTPSAASSAAKPSFSGSSPLGNPSVEAHHTPSATPSAAKPSFSGSSPASQERPRPTHEEIARRAYEHFLLRSQSGGQSGGQSGDKDKEDWYKAEQELLSKK